MKYFIIPMIIAAVLTLSTETDNVFSGAVNIIHSITAIHGK